MARLTPRTVRVRFDELYQMIGRIKAEHLDTADPVPQAAKATEVHLAPQKQALHDAKAELLLLERQFNEDSIGARGLSRRRLKAYLRQLDAIHGDVYFSKPWPFGA